MPKLPEGTYPVDPIFEDFYTQHGGVDVFGYAISSAYSTVQGKKAQYFESVLMVYDTYTGTVSFESIGLDLNLGELPVANWSGATEGGIFVGPHFIHPAFASLYLSLGADVVGAPLTDPFHNIAQNRIEQHFETLGFYIDLSNPNATASLLHYGRLHCGGCNLKIPQTENAIVAPMLSDAAFYSEMVALGINYSMVGKLVEGPLSRTDGSTDLVFDSLVLYEQDGRMGIRNVPVMLGFQEDQLYYPSSDPFFVFYPIDNGGGQNVLTVFDDFIMANGGYDVSGKPISSLRNLDAATEELVQCFENYCLIYNPSTQSVAPMPIGERYLQGNAKAYVQPKIGSEGELGGFGNDGGEDSTTTRNPAPFTLIAQEQHYNIDSQTNQVLTFWVKHQETAQPGMELVLTITFPDKHEETITMPPTDQEGKTSYQMAPIPGQNGSLVRYEACLIFADQPPACVEQVFMIWGNP